MSLMICCKLLGKILSILEERVYDHGILVNDGAGLGIPPAALHAAQYGDAAVDVDEELSGSRDVVLDVWDDILVLVSIWQVDRKTLR
jgi:hypothetical protein